MTMTYFLHCTHPFTGVILLILRCSTPSSKTKIYTFLESISSNTHSRKKTSPGSDMRSRQEHDAWSLKKQSIASIDKLKKLSNETYHQITHPYAIGYTADQIATLFKTNECHYEDS